MSEIMPKEQKPKKTNKWLTTIVVLVAVLTVICAIPFAVFMIVLPIDSAFWPKGVYHIPTYVEQTCFSFFVDDDVYFVSDTYSSYKRLYKYDSNDEYSIVSLKYQDKTYPEFSGFCTNDDYYFLSTEKEMFVCDKALNIIDSYSFNNDVRSLAAYDSLAFVLIGHNDEMTLHCVDYQNHASNSIIKNIHLGSINEYLDLSFFVNNRGELFITSMDNIFFANEYSIDVCGLNYGIINMSIKNDEIVVTYSDSVFTFVIPYQAMFKRVYLKQDKILFGCYEKNEVDECKVHTNCICDFGNCALYYLDLQDFTLHLISTYNSGTFLIDYDFDGSVYYYNGQLLDEGEYVRTCSLIEVGDKITMNKGDGKNEFNKRYHLSYAEGVILGV